MLIKVTVFPGSHEDIVIEKSPGTYEVYVRAQAQNGHANKMVVLLLSKYFGKGVQLISGGTRTHKICKVL